MLNKVTIIGNLGNDPEVRFMPNGGQVATLSVATTRRWKDKNGEKVEETEWHRVVLFGKLAEIAGEYLKKGSKCYIEGRLQTRKWQDKDNIDRYTTEIVGNELIMLGEKGEKKENGAQSTPRQSHSAPPPPPVDDFDSDDIPFR